MRGWAALHRPPTRTSLAEARQLFEQALVLDDHSADALVGLAYARARAASSGFTASMDAELDGALATILRALELAPERATAHWVHGIILRRPKQFAEAAAAFEKAIQLDRNFAAAYGSLADTKTWLGQLKETVELVERAIRLSPHDPLLANWQFYAGTACWYAGDLDQAYAWYIRARASNPQLWFVCWSLAGVYALRDQMDLARAELARAQRGMAWVTSVEKLKDYMPTTEPKMLERDEKWYELLRLIGLPDR
jgi:tetratricopeptide (TPR) repeat protein